MKAPVTLMWNKSKTLLVPVGDVDGRFFAYAEGEELPEGAPLKNMPAVPNKAVPAREKKEMSNG